jgi:hypothetical protein
MSIYEHREISDEDQSLLKIFYRLWRDGEYPLYLTRFDLPIQTVTQTDLFNAISSDNTSTTCDGIELVIDSSETKKEKEDDKD